MTAVLSPVSLSGFAPDTRSQALVGPGASASSRAPSGETAQAMRPVDPTKTAQDVRAETARDKPVGPPPSFEINVLQDMRARAAASEKSDAGKPGTEAVEAADKLRRAETEQPAPPDRVEQAPVYEGTSLAVDPTLNRMV